MNLLTYFLQGPEFANLKTHVKLRGWAMRTYCIARGTPLNVTWQPWIGGTFGGEWVHVHVWPSLLTTWNYCNVVNWLYLNTKYKKKKKVSGWNPDYLPLFTYSSFCIIGNNLLKCFLNLGGTEPKPRVTVKLTEMKPKPHKLWYKMRSLPTVEQYSF